MNIKAEIRRNLCIAPFSYDHRDEIRFGCQVQSPESSLRGKYSIYAFPRVPYDNEQIMGFQYGDMTVLIRQRGNTCSWKCKRDTYFVDVPSAVDLPRLDIESGKIVKMCFVQKEKRVSFNRAITEINYQIVEQPYQTLIDDQMKEESQKVILALKKFYVQLGLQMCSQLVEKEFQLPDEWRKIILTSNDTEGDVIAEYSQTFLWESYHPFDGNSPFEIRGLIAYQDFDARTAKFCNILSKSDDFQDYLSTVKPDIIVVDFHDCMSALSSLFNTTVIHFSNWPIFDVYLRSFGVVGTSPAAYPETTLPYSGLGMSFFQRITNLWIRLIKYLFRGIGEWRSSKTVPGLSLRRIESKRLLYASRYQMLAEPVRPISQRIRYFGYNPILNRPSRTVEKAISEEFLGEIEPSLPSPKNWTLKNGKSDGMLNYQNESCTDFCQRPTRNYLKFISNEELETLLMEKFVLITFGSLAKISLMNKAQFTNMVTGFGVLPFPVIWQADQRSEEKFDGISIPKNVYFADWLPVKRILSLDTLQFIVSHGGVNTLNEMLQMGATGILMPLQGDQCSNARRLHDLGVVEFVTPHRLEMEAWKKELRGFVGKLDKFQARAAHFSKMLVEHAQLNEVPQKYWLEWALRHGKKSSVKRLMGVGVLQDWNFEMTISAAFSFLIFLYTI
ncbi:unnamed protein product, partial [Mesorhabditis belari]|uniref:glucuronosyltransferase n=1 Tax=Mesorhabditis belari TaxID=2138241 RepID=A0AAF3FLT6_9BILA